VTLGSWHRENATVSHSGLGHTSSFTKALGGSHGAIELGV
jgi:hypothetical protein